MYSWATYNRASDDSLEKSVNALMFNIYDSLDVTILILFSFNHCANAERRNFSILWNVGSQSSWSLFWI